MEVTKRIYNPKLLFVCHLGITLMIYWSTFHSRNVFDHADYIYNYDGLSVSEFITPMVNSAVTCLYFTDLIYFIQLKLIPYNSIFNGILACFFHSLLVLLIYIFSFKILEVIAAKDSEKVALWASLFFLISPYASEVVVWGCTVYFIYIGILLFLVLLSLIWYIESAQSKYLYLIAGWYILALFTNELSFFFIPIAFIVYILFHKKISFQIVVDFAYKFYFMPVLMVAYLGLRFVLKGTFIGHYGEDIHLSFPIKEMLIHLHQYILKFSIGLNSFKTFQPLNTYLKDHVFRYSLLFLLFILACVWIFRKKLNFKFVLLIISAFFVLIFPVLNLAYYDYTIIQGGRYGYLASSFIYILISYIMFQIFEGYVRYIILSIFFVSNLYLVLSYNKNWTEAKNIMHSLESQQYGVDNHYFLLNMPCSYKGAYMYKGGYGQSPFMKRLKLSHGDYQNNFREIFSINLTGKSDKLEIEKLDDKNYRIRIADPDGNWFWRGDWGASNYYNKFYDVKTINGNLEYRLRFDSIPTNSYLLHYENSKMKKIRL